MRTLISTNNSSSFSLSRKLRLSAFSALVFFLGMGSVWGQTTLINYNFNDAAPTGYSSYSPSAITNIGAAITSTETHATPTGGIASGSNAFTSNTTAGSALHATNSSGTNTKFHTITLTGSALPTYGTFGIYFQAQRSNAGAQIITVQYSKDGGSFTTFTSNTSSVGTSFTEGLFTLPSSANNPTTSLALRLFFSGASGSGTCRIDNFQVRGTSSGPNINVSSSLTSFITSAVSTTSTEQSFSVSGTNLTNNISITPPTGYEISLTNGGSFLATSPITLTPASGTVAATTIYTRFNPTALSDQVGGNVTCSSTGATTQNIAVAGEVTNLSVGAISFIAFQGATTDLYRIVALQDIPANTRIWFTDKAWDGNGGTLAFTTGEGNNVWTNTTGSTITAGTVIQFDAVGAATVGTGGLNAGLGSAGEQLFAYQGTLTNPTFVAGYTSGTTISSGIPTASGTETWIPAALTNGTNFVALEAITFGSSYVTAPTHYRTLADHRTHIHTVGNLTTGSTTTTTNSSWPTYSFYFLPNEPTTQPSFTTATSVGNNQVTLNFTGGNGSSYMLVMRQGSAVGAAPTDATSYSAVSGSVDFTTATELSAGQRIVYNGTTSGTSVTVTNLSPGTTYHYAIYAYNGTGTLANFNTTSPGTGSETTTGSANSAVSDIITDGSFTEPSNIAYHSNQENTNLTAVNSVEVARFSLRDGGATIDIDANSTTLTAITFSVTNFSILRRLALYNGATELGEVAVSSSSVSFSGLTLAAADNGAQDFSLRASFAGTVTDNTQFSFAVSSATADPAGSTFAAANAGVAATSTSGDRNRIEVTATLLTFVQQPSNVSVNTAMTPAPTVSANDALGNRDLDYTTDMAVTTSGSFGAATTTTSPVSGLGTFSNLQFSASATARTIAVSSGSLTASGNSNNFDIVAFGDVIISEISYESTNEWIELHNTTGSSIDISGWYITDHSVYPATSEGDCVIPSSTSIPAGGYLVVSTSGTGSSADDLVDIIGEVLSAVGPRGASNRPQLSNSGDNMALYTAASGGTLMDGSLSVNFPDYSGSGTISIERIARETWGTSAFGQSSTPFASTTYPTSSPGTVGNPTLQANVAVTNLATRTGQIINLSTRTLTIVGTISGSGTINASSGTVAFGNTSNLSLPTAFFTGAIANLSKTAGAGTLTLNDALTTVGNLSTAASTGAVILAAGKQLTLTGALVNNGAMIIETGATFKQGTSVTGSGTYNVQQYLTGSNTGGVLDGRYWYIGSPLVSTRQSAFGSESTTRKVWAFSSGAYANVTNSTSLSPTSGYVYRRGSDTTLTFSGQDLYAQDATLPLSNNASTYAGWHLVSNPYTAYLNWDDVVSNSTGMSNTYYIRSYNSSSLDLDALISYNSVNGLESNTSSFALGNVGSTTGQHIAPLQAFWVKVNPTSTLSSTAGQLNLQRAFTSHQTGTLKSTGVYPVLARVNLYNGVKYDQALVYMNEFMTNSSDQNDSEKMFVSGVASIYTMASGKKLVMNGLKNNKKKISVPLYLELPTSKVYQLQLSEYIMEDGLILLEDKQEGTIQVFTIHDTYEFYANSGVLSNRFVLHFFMPDAGVSAQGPSNSWVEEESAINEGGSILVSSNGRGKVTITQDIEATPTAQGSVVVRDAAGRIVYEGQIEGTQTNIQLSTPSGIYFVEVQFNGQEEVKKIFVEQ